MSAGPLVGLRVVELAGLGPGPATARLLADLGADVVRVQRPGYVPDESGPTTLPGRATVTADLKSDQDVAQVLSLVDRADVLLEGFRPGVTERLGLGPEVCAGRNCRLIYVRLTGWGQTGPWASMAGHDINYISVTGVLDALGRRGGPPQIPLNLLGDIAGGTMHALVGILAALHERVGSGQGQVLDVAIADGTASLSSFIHGMRASGAWTDTRGANLVDSGAPFYDVYETADAGWMAVGAIEPQFWDEVLRLLDLDDVPDRRDPSTWPAVRALLTDRFRQRSRKAWEAVFDGTDACVTPVLSWAEAPAHPHLRARGVFDESHGFVQPAPAPLFSRTPGAVSPATVATDVSSVLRRWGA